MNIIEPTLLLDKVKCRNNIRSMVKKATGAGISFRPHFKTHNCREIGKWFRDEGVDKVTVSSVKMAAYFADDGWEDITIAIVFNILETGKVNEILKSGTNINLIVDSPETLSVLKKELKYQVSIFIKIDTGYNRTGILSDEIEKIEVVVKAINDAGMRFAGFLTHSGHSYKATSTNEILDIYNDTLRKMGSLKQRFRNEYPDIVISVGDTPTISITPDLRGVDEIRPGNFVFYDLMQLSLGSCTSDDIAVVLAAPVISRNTLRKEVVVHGGAVHISKEFISDPSGRSTYGQPVILKADGWEKLSGDSYVSSVSQEHSIIKADDEFFDSVSTGDVIGIVPVHSCLAANLMGSYLTLDGERIMRDRS